MNVISSFPCHVSLFPSFSRTKPFPGVRPSLAEKLSQTTADRKRISDEALEKQESLSSLNKRFTQAQHLPQSSDSGRSLGRSEFFNQRRSVQEILFAIGEMLNNYHTVR